MDRLVFSLIFIETYLGPQTIRTPAGPDPAHPGCLAKTNNDTLGEQQPLSLIVIPLSFPNESGMPGSFRGKDPGVLGDVKMKQACLSEAPLWCGHPACDVLLERSATERDCLTIQQPRLVAYSCGGRHGQGSGCFADRILPRDVFAEFAAQFQVRRQQSCNAAGQTDHREVEP